MKVPLIIYGYAGIRDCRSRREVIADIFTSIDVPSGSGVQPQAS